MSAQVSAGPASRTTQEMAAKPSVKPTATMSDRFDMPLLGDIVISVVNARLFESSLGPATTPQLVEPQMDELEQVAGADRIRLDRVHCQHWIEARCVLHRSFA